MKKKWARSSRTTTQQTQSSEVIVANDNGNEEQCALPQKVITNIFNAITKLDRDELEKLIETHTVSVVLKQKLWGLSVGHVLVNRSDDEVLKSNDKNMIEKVNEMLIYLIDKGLDLNVEDNKSRMKPIHLAAKRCSFSFKWIETMIEKGNQCATTFCGSDNGFTPLEYAISNGRLELVRSILECQEIDFGEFLYSNSNSTESGRRRWLPIHVASQSGAVEILELLIDNALNSFQNNRSKIPELLLNELSTTPASLDSFVKYFLNIKSKDLYSQTPLHLAVQDGHVSCIKLLLEKGANPLSMDQNSKTVIDYARINFINKHVIIDELQKYVDFEILPPIEIMQNIVPFELTTTPKQTTPHDEEDNYRPTTDLNIEEHGEENENIYFM